MKIKVGVIGLGFMGSAHARVYNTIEGCELVAICDSNPEKKFLAKAYGCKFFEDSVEFLFKKVREKLDLITLKDCKKEVEQTGCGCHCPGNCCFYVRHSSRRKSCRIK